MKREGIHAHTRLFLMAATLGSVLCALLMFKPVMASSQPLPVELIDNLRLGGYVIVFRHGATVSVQSNADSMSRNNVAAARQLNEQGRRRQNRSGSRCAS